MEHNPDRELLRDNLRNKKKMLIQNAPQRTDQPHHITTNIFKQLHNETVKQRIFAIFDRVLWVSFYQKPKLLGQLLYLLHYPTHLFQGKDKL